MTAYSHLNADTEVFDFKGSRKPLWACGLSKMSLKAMSEGWESYTAFVRENQGAKMSFRAVKCYSWQKAREVAKADLAFPWRRGLEFWM